MNGATKSCASTSNSLPTTGRAAQTLCSRRRCGRWQRGCMNRRSRPACRITGKGPHELRALIEVLREAPLGWFGVRPKLTSLDRHEVLFEVAQHAKLRDDATRRWR